MGMSKWLEEIKRYHSEGDTKVKVVIEGRKILVYDITFLYGDGVTNKYRGITFKKMGKTYVIKKDGHRHMWCRKTFRGYGVDGYSWGECEPCNFDYLSKDLKYLENVLWLSEI
jgi:hypothetical protein